MAFQKMTRCDFPAAKRGVAMASLSVCPLTLKQGCYLNILQKVFEFRATLAGFLGTFCW